MTCDPEFPIRFKSPGADRVYRLNLAKYLGVDTIVSFTNPSLSSDLTIVSSSHTDTTISLKISGGTLEVDYVVTTRFTTAAGVTDDRSFLLKVRQT
jgi:hypothetical protein